MIKKILIYNDRGAQPLCVASLFEAFQQEGDRFCIDWADRGALRNGQWEKETDLLIFPGGRDIPYHEALKGLGNACIREFVERGGRFLGICAGGYYGSGSIEFEKGGELEVVAERELRFFPGVAQGPAYGLGKFRYQSEEGAQIARLDLADMETASYYNGGCLFVDAEKYEGVSVLARYADISSQPAAIVKCRVGKGCAILSGVHPEYSADHECIQNHIEGDLFFALKQIERERRHLFSTLLNQLN